MVDVCEEHEKEDKLLKLLKEFASDKQNKIIIFVETKKKSMISRKLSNVKDFPQSVSTVTNHSPRGTMSYPNSELASFQY